ncbi:MAG TPA: hypothetical protein VMT69_05545 [Kineosporiaceae bacterium]|nr:hypothetical protein [Kineosporiaceae bacterium]
MTGEFIGRLPDRATFGRPWRIVKAGQPLTPGASRHASWLGGSYGISFWKKITVPPFPFQRTSAFW